MSLLALVVATTAFATSAQAHPSYPSKCSGCHGGPSLTVTATQKSETSTTVTYNVSASTASAIAVFNGSSKVATILGSAGSVTVNRGGTYAIIAVRGPSTGSGFGQTSVTPSAKPAKPVVTTTTLVAPKTVAVKTWLSVTGSVAAKTGTATGKVKVTRSRLVGSKWKVVGSAKVLLAKGAFKYRFKPTAKGSWRVVAAYAGITYRGVVYAGSSSPTSTVTVN
jgi:hypothetical protein